MEEDYDEVDNTCGICHKLFEDCMCCECGSEDGVEYQEGVMCEDCHEDLTTKGE